MDNKFNNNDCPEEKKKWSLKNKLGQLILSGEDEEKLAKNAAAYERAKKRRKVRKIIIFAIITAVILATYGFAFIFVNTLPYYSAISRFAQVHILGRGYYYSYRYYFYIDGVRHYYDQPVRYTVEAAGNRFLRSALAILTGFIIITIVHFIIKLTARGDSKRRKTIVSLVASLTKYIGYIVVLIILFEVWDVNQAVLAAAIAALGIAIGFGAQGLVGDLLTGLFLIFEDNLQVGDIVTVGDFRGEIEDLGIRTTRLANIGGDVMIINNSQFVRFINMSMHRSFAVCDVVIEYDENLEKIEQIINDNLEIIAEKFPAITDGPFYKGVVEFNNRGVMLRVVAKVSETARLQLNRDLNRELKILFDRHKIRLAVPKVEVVEHCEITAAAKKKK
ncbi:MAG: mechanosensitive ion channel family protein [Firmicutes bacterium]|nr:mechanosensitive ion channel family protein [Bacillota bacterium]